MIDESNPRPVKPWHEYPGNDKVHMPKDHVLSRQENHMNDTTRDELVADVQKAISDTFDMANEYRYNDTSERAQGGVNLLAKALSADIVRMVTAARDAEIREAAMTLGVMRQVSNAIGLTPFTVLNPRTTAQVAVEAMLKAIGLAEKGAER